MRTNQLTFKRMNKLKFWAVLLFMSNSFFAQENLSYQKPSKEILALADFERAPSVSMDSKKENIFIIF